MKIAILGTGNVGRALGTSWAYKGHEVIFGSRDPHSEKVQAMLAAAPQAKAMTTQEAAAAAPIIVLATPWNAVASVVTSIQDWTDKILVDCTNPIAPGFKLALGYTTSGAEQVAVWAPGANVVKAYNTTGAENMADPIYNGEAVTMFICGDEAAAKETVLQLTRDLGFDAVDVGPLNMARHLEPLAMLWIKMALVNGMGRNIAFKLVRR